jgi:hypothetical protein
LGRTFAERHPPSIGEEPLDEAWPESEWLLGLPALCDAGAPLLRMLLPASRDAATVLFIGSDVL